MPLSPLWTAPAGLEASARPAGPWCAGRVRASALQLPFLLPSQDLEDLEEAEEPDLEDDDDQKAVKDEL